MAMVSEVLGLKFKATVYHIGDGYFYYKNSTDRNKFYLRCAVSKLCPGRGNMPRQPEARLASSLVTSRPHSHPPQPNWLDVNTLRTSILRRCETTSTPYRQIQREESERVDIDVAAELPYHALSKAMQRARRAANGPVPSTLQEYGEALPQNPRNERTRTPTDVESCYDLSYAPSYADKTEHVEDRYPDEMDHTERPAGVMEDTLNLFGRYVSSILRQLPIGKSYTLQQKFINEAISAKLEHESQYPSTPRCQNGTSPSMNNTTTAPVVVSNHTNTVVCPNTTSQRKRRKRKTSSSCAQPSSPLHIKQEVEESELSDLRGDKEITDTGTVISEDVASIEFEEGDFIGIKSEMEESDSALFTSSEHNKESRMAGSMTERLRPPPSSHCTYQTNNERVLVCSLCSISFTSSQDLRNHQNEQHPDNPYAKTKPPNENQISSKRRCIEAGTTYYSPTLPGPYTTHRDSSLSTTSQEPSTLESTNDPLA